tara:strand:+ start:245 stop:2053 length:1809 start_codon:yes stop_codon:yes gene_type:complete
VAAEPTPKDGESHDEYMTRCKDAGYTEEECMKAHEGHEFEVESYYDDDEKKKKKYASEDCGCGCCGAEVAYEDWEETEVSAAEYQGRKVTLNKPFRTKGANKKFGVYTKNEKGNVVLVRFGDPNMEIKRDDPARRKSFRSRHNCDSPGPKWKARYWSCRQWRGGKKVEAEEPCGCKDESVEAKRKDDPCTEGYEQYGMKEKNGRQVPNCVPIKKKAEECGYGEEMIDGECRKVAVTLELDIDESKAILSADTGNTIIEISGVAFHEGMNKNKWALTPEGAISVVRQMDGADLTLLHPKADETGAGFTRNTDGGLEEAVVGTIVGATFFTTQGGYEVRYVAHVTREELFESFDDGIWMQDGYGVSIGGSGIPVEASEDGLVFGEDFTFDHLALVVKPAYERASVEKAEYKTINKEEELPTASSQEMFIGHSISEEIKPTVIAMTEDTVTNEIDYEAEMESLKADLVLATSRIAEYESVEADRVEAERISLVEKATELGMSGHDDLKAETLSTLIASWEEAHPEPVPVEMTPVESEVKPVAETVEASEDAVMVENYLNGRVVKNDEKIYAKAWNAWASAWNQTLATDERRKMSAPRYADLKEMN